MKFLFNKSSVVLAIALYACSTYAIDYNPALKKGINLTNIGSKWDGLGPYGEKSGTVELPYARIPSMVITNEGKIVVMFDLRWKTKLNGVVARDWRLANDQQRIDPGIAISSDSGYTWDKATAWVTKKEWKSRGNAPQWLENWRRTMDTTMLYNHNTNELFALHGVWSANNLQWYGGRERNWNTDVWAAQIHKSTDNGKTWKKITEFKRTKNIEVFKNTTKSGYPMRAFLGGVGTGIVTKNGTLVFPIQTAHVNGIGATILYSEDNGVTWKMPNTNQVVAPNQSSLENMVLEIDNKLVLTGRGNGRWAYYTEDMGLTWNKFYAIDGFHFTSSQASQGSSIYVTLPNGRQVVLISKPNGNNDGYARGNLALWVLDGKHKNHKKLITIFREGSGNPAGAGYSSLAYRDGKLLVAYEDDGNITVKDLSDFIPMIEKQSIDWNLPNTL